MILPAYPLKSSNLFNFREQHQKGRGTKRGGGINRGAHFQQGAQTGNLMPLLPIRGHDGGEPFFV